MEIYKEERKVINSSVKDIFSWYLETRNPQTPDDIQVMGGMMKDEIDVVVKEAIEDLKQRTPGGSR